MCGVKRLRDASDEQFARYVMRQSILVRRQGIIGSIPVFIERLNACECVSHVLPVPFFVLE